MSWEQSKYKLAWLQGEGFDQPTHPLQSDQGRHCPYAELLGPWLPIECLAKTLIRLRGSAG